MTVRSKATPAVGVGVDAVTLKWWSVEKPTVISEDVEDIELSEIVIV